MMIALGLVGAALLLAWRQRRRQRKDVLAGLEDTRPTFSVAPPARSLTSWKEHRW